MRLLLFSDLHCDADAARRIVQLAGQVDVVVGAGDFATMRRNLQITLDVLRQIAQPTVLVPGNSETFDELQGACAGWGAARVLHGSGCQVLDTPFYGLGGAVPPTPFGDWSFDLSEDDARRLLSDCPDRAVIVTHSPPKGLVDRSSSGASLGSLAVREAIERTAAQLVVCGHIHESAGQAARLGECRVINAGPQGVIHELSR